MIQRGRNVIDEREVKTECNKVTRRRHNQGQLLSGRVINWVPTTNDLNSSLDSVHIEIRAKITLTRFFSPV